MPGAILKDSSSALVNTVPLSLSSLPVRQVQQTPRALPSSSHPSPLPCASLFSYPAGAPQVSLSAASHHPCSIHQPLPLPGQHPLQSKTSARSVAKKKKKKKKTTHTIKQTKRNADGLHIAEGDLKRGGKGADTQEMNS